MSAHIDTEFVDLLKSRIDKKCLKFGQFDCFLWQGAKWGKSSYGKVAVKLPGSDRRAYFRVHRLVYMLYNNFNPLHAETDHKSKLTLSSHDDKGNLMDVSHLCHNTLCTNPGHLLLELHCINMERLHCKHQGSCTLAHTPHCII